MNVGDHELLDEIGRGGTATVYRARARDGRDVAVKLLREARPDARARFERERRLLAAFGEDEGFVPLLEAGEARGGAYIVMPFLAGGTLRERLRGGPLPIEEARALVLALARAAGRAHARGVVHRDLKPENVLFTKNGRPLIADLGLAKHFTSDTPGGSQSVDLSRSHHLAGTAGYMAPEQMLDASSVGPEADVFALGAILHECLTGEPAFRGESPLEVIAAISAGVTVAPPSRLRPETPPWLDRVVSRALAHEPEARFSDGAELAGALEAGKTPAGRSRRPLVALALVLAAAAAGAIGLRLRARAASRAHAERGHDLVRRHAYEAALVELDEALRLDGGNARAWAHRGEAKSELLDRSAVADARRAVELDPGDAYVWVVLAVCDGREPGTLPGPGTLPALDRALVLDPGFARAWANRGAVKIHAGDLDGALRDIEKALALDPGLVIGHNFRGAVLQRRGDLKGAEACFTRMIELDPGNVHGWRSRGHMRCDLGDLSGTIADFTRAIEVAPRMSVVWRDRGDARSLVGEHTDAIADISRAVDLAATPREKAEAFVARAAARSKAGDLAGAIADNTSAIDADSHVARAWSNRASVRRRMDGSREESIRDATRAIELDPGLVQPWETRASSRVELRDYAGAIEDATRAIELHSKDAWFTRSQARLATSDFQGAVADLRKSVELEPRYSTWHALGFALELTGDLAPALDAYTRALEFDRDQPRACHDRGLLREKLGDREGATADLARFLELSPGGADAAVSAALDRLKKP